MENDNNTNQENGSTYHYGRNESPFGKEDISGKASTDNPSDTNTFVNNNMNTSSNSSQSFVNTNPNDSNLNNQQNVYNNQYYNQQNSFNGENVDKKRKKKKEKKPSSGKGKKVGLFIGAAVLFGLIAGSIMVGVNAVGNKLFGYDNKTELATVSTTNDAKEILKGESVADVAEEVMPSIVSITNTSVQTVRSWFQSYEQEVSGSGSGIIIGQTNNEILVVTNNHVIEGAEEITVAFSDETAAAATVKGYDSVMDLAVVSVKTKDLEEKTLKHIKVAALGSSENLRVGSSAIAIGNALGYGQSVTVGYISAVNREVDMEKQTMKLLQTDAAINPGNSGGALLNAKGEVIGINTIKFVDSTVEGMGYAIPISTAIPVINDLMHQEVIEESEQGYLGIQGNDITDEYAEGFNMPKGVYVVKIVDDSPAENSGLKAGDIITKFADRDVASMETLRNILANKKAGEEIKMEVQRNNEKGEYEKVTLKVTLGAKKDMPSDEKKNEEKAKKEKKQEQQPEQLPPEDIFTPEEFLDEFFNN